MKHQLEPDDMQHFDQQDKLQVAATEHHSLNVSGEDKLAWPKFFLEKDEDPWIALERKNKEIDALAPGLRNKVWNSIILVGTAVLFAIFFRWFVR
jgi:hypothetical protein